LATGLRPDPLEELKRSPRPPGRNMGPTSKGIWKKREGEERRKGEKGREKREGREGMRREGR